MSLQCITALKVNVTADELERTWIARSHCTNASVVLRWHNL